MEKKKILVLSDHPLSPSGVGIQTRYMIEDLLKTGKIKNLKVKHFKKFGSERKLYNFNIDNISDY